MSSENSLLICQYCENETQSQFNFCSKCYSQIKCINCGAKIFNGSPICLQCGTALVAKMATGKSNNIYTRHVKKDGENYEEDVRFELTDESVEKIAPFIVRQTMPNEKSYRGSLQEGKGKSSHNDVSEYEDLTDISEEKDDLGENQNSSSSGSVTKSKGIITQYFKNDNGNIVAIENDFRGKTWSEQQKNFIILYTKAHLEIMGKPLPDREIVREAAKRLNLLDSNNFSTYFTKTSAQYMTELSNGFELNTKGNKEFENIIKLMLDEKSGPGFAYAGRPSSGASKKARISSEEKSTVDSWLTDEVNLGKLDVRNVKSGRDAALLALWILTIKLGKVKAAPIYILLYYLNKKFTTISVTQAAISKAITQSKDADKYFQKNNEDEYFLSTIGQKMVEDWVSGTTPLN